MSDWLDETQRRIEALAAEVDNVRTPVQYRAPMAELEHLAIDLALQVDLLKGQYQDLLKDFEGLADGDYCLACGQPISQLGASTST
jgi:hypothetical protein